MRYTLSLLATVVVLGAGYATTVTAQPQREVQPQSVDTRADRDDGFNMGWLGLLGLAGLLGMKRSEGRERPIRSDSSVSSTGR